MTRIKFLFTLLSVAIIVSRVSGEHNISDSTQSQKIRVGIAGSPPFIITNGNYYSGISLQLWQRLAAKAHFVYKVKKYDNVNDALSALKAGKEDILVGPFSITADRTKIFSFSQPYYASSLSLMALKNEPTLWDKISLFFSKKLLLALIAFLSILALVGTLFWLAERKKSPKQFPADPVKGIGNGMWLAIVTMTTTGYGDTAPVTLWGRIIASSWMIVSLVFAASFIAGIASVLTLSGLNEASITKINQLTNKKVAVIKNSPATNYIQSPLVKKVTVDNLNAAYEKLKDHQADAIIYDRPQLLYFLSKNNDKKLLVSNEEYYKQGYGFVMPLNSALTKKVNFYLLQLAEEGFTNRVIKSWLGEEKNHPEK